MEQFSINPPISPSRTAPTRPTKMLSEPSRKSLVANRPRAFLLSHVDATSDNRLRSVSDIPLAHLCKGCF
jgi:hypothetical protein